MADEVGPKEKLQVLLAEYNTLRTQIIARGTLTVQIITIGVAALAATAAWLNQQPILAIAVFLFLLMTVVIIGRMTRRDLDEEAAHVTKLEGRINQIVGEDLLTWEAKHGRVGAGYWHGFFSNKNSN